MQRTNTAQAPCRSTKLPLSKEWVATTTIVAAEILLEAISVSKLACFTLLQSTLQLAHFNPLSALSIATEHHLAKISNARHAFAVSSGMAALDVITRLLKAGDEVIAGDDLYGGTNRLLAYLKAHQGVTVHHVDTTNPESLHPVLKAGKTAMVLLESPTNPLLKIADLATICSDIRARAPDAVIVVDNTMMSPYLQRPLEHGADLVYDSGTKYLSGHHDLMAGVVVCNRDDVAKVIGYIGLLKSDHGLIDPVVRKSRLLSTRSATPSLHSTRSSCFAGPRPSPSEWSANNPLLFKSLDTFPTWGSSSTIQDSKTTLATKSTRNSPAALEPC